MKSFVVILFFLMGSLSRADLYTPVSVTASSTFSTYNKNNLINDSGLSAPVSLDSMHDSAYTNQWMSDSPDISPWLIFDLGTQMLVSSAHIWNYSFDTTRATKTLNLEYSIDGNIWQTLLTGASLAQYSEPVPVQTLLFGEVSAQYIKLSVTSNYGNINYSGLGEVKFGTQAIPEPTSALLIGSGSALLMLVRRAIRFHQARL